MQHCDVNVSCAGRQKFSADEREMYPSILWRMCMVTCSQSVQCCIQCNIAKSVHKYNWDNNLFMIIQSLGSMTLDTATFTISKLHLAATLFAVII
jgi:hypothetical protein